MNIQEAAPIKLMEGADDGLRLKSCRKPKNDENRGTKF
jgi:hypothetical protein